MKKISQQLASDLQGSSLTEHQLTEIKSLQLIENHSDTLPEPYKSLYLRLMQRLRHSWSGAKEWRNEFLEDIRLSKHRANEIYTDYNDHYFSKRKELGPFIHFYSKPIERFGGLNYASLDNLTMMVAAYCHNGNIAYHEIEEKIGILYRLTWTLELLNEWKENNAPLEDSDTISKLPDSFEACFFNSDDLRKAIDILYKITASKKLKVIDSNGLWLGGDRDGSRSVLLAWIEVLRVQGWFKVKVENKRMSNLLNSHFDGLELSITDDSLWRKQKDSSNANSYHADFLQHIKKL